MREECIVCSTKTYDLIQRIADDVERMYKLYIPVIVDVCHPDDRTTVIGDRLVKIMRNRHDEDMILLTAYLRFGATIDLFDYSRGG